VTQAPDIVLDVGVPLAWVVSTQGTAYTSGVWHRMPKAVAVVPGSWPLELAQAVRFAERRGSLTPAQSANKLTGMAGFNIRIDGQPFANHWPAEMGISRSHRLSSFDATSLDLADRFHLPLDTIDSSLTRAAAAVGVPLFVP
jgi:hypothetical protein